MICRDCPAELCKTNKSGFCLRCYPKNRPEGHGRRVSKGIRKMYAMRPEVLDAVKRRARDLSSVPGIIARRTRKFVENKTWERGAASQTPKDRERANQSIEAKRLAWCPPDLRKMYLDIRKKGFSVTEAKEAVLEHERVQLDRLRARMAKN